MAKKKPNALIVGTGEYTTGYVYGSASASDKKVGVVGLVLFDLKRRGFVNNISFAGTNGTKFPAIRQHFKEKIEKVYKNMDTSFTGFPADNVERDPDAYVAALNSLQKGDLVFVFTPDDTHYVITKAAVERGLHVLVTKPVVKELSQHLELSKLSIEKNVLVSIEVHKRWDPMYSDIYHRIRNQFGDFSYFSSYMSQPKFQLMTFKQWAGKSSDISYYLNSHHVDFHCWSQQGLAVPVRLVAMGSTGIAKNEPFSADTEDTITLMVQWKNLKSGNLGTAVYTASWVAPKADVHSQQGFHYMGFSGEARVDQGHRGYYLDTDENGHQAINPLYMKYTPDTMGYYSGQGGYGYRSLEEFVTAATELNAEEKPDPRKYDHALATIWVTATSTAILQAGRQSLDNGGRAVLFEFDSTNTPVKLVLA